MKEALMKGLKSLPFPPLHETKKVVHIYVLVLDMFTERVGSVGSYWCDFDIDANDEVIFDSSL